MDTPGVENILNRLKNLPAGDNIKLQSLWATQDSSPIVICTKLRDALRTNHIFYAEENDGADSLQALVLRSESAVACILKADFNKLVVFDVRKAHDDLGSININILYRYIRDAMVASFGTFLGQDIFRIEEIFQILRDESCSLFCFVHAELIPPEIDGFIRAFTQDRHRVLFLCTSRQRNPTEKSPSSLAKLYIYLKIGESYSYSLKNAPMTLGRSADNDIPLPDPFVNGRHAVIYPDESDGFAIRDNGSKNGTFVNGKRLTGPVDLKEGDEILIGSVRITCGEPKFEFLPPKPPGESDSILAYTMVEMITETFPERELRLAAQTQSDHRVFSIINEVSLALVSHQTLPELLEHIMDLICTHIPMDRGIMMLKEGNPVQLIPKVIRINAKSLQNKKIQVSRSIITMAFDQQLSVLSSDAAVDPRFKALESIIDSGIHSLMCVPLWNNKEIIGILYADRISFLQPFTEEDLRLLTLLSNLAAVKIENAMLIESSIKKEKMEREPELAARIQKDFLPKADPSCENFDIAGKNVPCLQVGGDYYDFIPIGGGRLGIVVADVSGKGVSACLLMASLRAALHSEVRPGYQPASMAEKLNEFVHQSSAINAFITFFYGELDTKSGAFVYVNAGHSPPLVFSSDGRVRTLDSTGMCLGMLPRMTFEDRSEGLKPGDTLVLYTDGITESRNKTAQVFGPERIGEICRTRAGSNAKDLIDAIFRGLEAFTNNAPAADDRTLVVIKRTS